jgi:hypothetical protein
MICAKFAKNWPMVLEKSKSEKLTDRQTDLQRKTGDQKKKSPELQICGVWTTEIVLKLCFENAKNCMCGMLKTVLNC